MKKFQAVAVLAVSLLMIGALADKPYIDLKNKFSLWPPAQWYMNNKDSRFAVKFSTTDYQAFIMADVTPYPGSVEIDDDFVEYIMQQNARAQEKYPAIRFTGSYQIVTVNGRRALRQTATFPAGENSILMELLYLPSPGKVFTITTVAPEAAAGTWRPVFKESVETFTILE